MDRRVQRVVMACTMAVVTCACGSGADVTDAVPASSLDSAPVAPHPLGDLRIADFGDVTTFDPALTQFAQAG
jgi:hypothetical protein